MTPMPLRLFVKKWQSKAGLAGYDIRLAYFVVEAKGRKLSNRQVFMNRPDTYICIMYMLIII